MCLLDPYVLLLPILNFPHIPHMSLVKYVKLFYNITSQVCVSNGKVILNTHVLVQYVHIYSTLLYFSDSVFNVDLYFIFNNLHIYCSLTVFPQYNSRYSSHVVALLKIFTYYLV